jgi:hypothetical protein
MGFPSMLWKKLTQRRKELGPQGVNLNRFELLFAPLREIIVFTPLAENRKC